MRTMLTDWRGPGRWTRADRRRHCDRASVSSLWDRNPFGLSSVEVLVGVQPGVLFYQNQPGGPAEGFNRALYDLACRDGLLTLVNPAYEEVLIWEHNDQKVVALDLTKPKAQEGFANLLLTHFPWANGLHLDYFTTLSWLDNSFPAEFWEAWQEGWRVVVERLRVARSDWTLLGQEWHLTPITDQVDGLFFEMSPGHFGLSFAEHEAMLARFGRPSECVYEFREPDRYPAEYVRQCLDWIDRQGCTVSYKRDAQALVGIGA